MISATLRSCGSVPLDRSVTSCPAALRLTEALNVAKRIALPSRSWASAGAATTAASARAATAIRSMAVTHPRITRRDDCESLVGEGLENVEPGRPPRRQDRGAHPGHAGEDEHDDQRQHWDREREVVERAGEE